jgi:hypothetical protein
MGLFEFCWGCAYTSYKQTNEAFTDFTADDLDFSQTFFMGKDSSEVQILDKLAQNAIEDMSALCFTFKELEDIEESFFINLFNQISLGESLDTFQVCDGEVKDVSKRDHLHLLFLYTQLVKNRDYYLNLNMKKVIPEMAQLNHEFKASLGYA